MEFPINRLAYPQDDLDHTLSAPWMKLTDKRLLITGANGWFGSWLCAAVSHAKAEIELTKIGRGDNFPDGDFDYVIHAAPAMTKEVLDFAAARNVRRFLYVSSGVARNGSVQGRHNAYAEMKRADEALCNASPLKPVIARCFSFVGPGQQLDGHWAIGNFLADATSGKNIMVKGDGSAIRSWMHMADLVVWLVTLLIKAERGCTYNVGSEEATSIAALADKVAAIAGTNVRILGKPSGPDYYVPSTIAAQELGLDTRIRLDSAITRTYAWILGQKTLAKEMA